MPSPRTTLSVALLLPTLFSFTASAQPTVWSALTVDFVRPDGADPTLVNDPISPSVTLTRGNTHGLYNLELESNYTLPIATSPSPAGTRWATGLNNPGATISATNWATLEFDTWRDAYGGSVGTTIVGTPAVLHLVAEDVYLDIQFSSWTTTFGGGFAYSRAEGELPDPSGTTGDYNGDGIVDAADYTVWRDTLERAVPPGTGADGDRSGMIDAADYELWKARFGQTVVDRAASGAVPEPSSSILLGASVVIAFARFAIPCNRSKRNRPDPATGCR